MTTPTIETARLVREYAQWALDECYLDNETKDPLLTAIVGTKPADAEACCHMGCALIALEEATSDAPYRLGGDMCDPRITEIAKRLGVSQS